MENTEKLVSLLIEKNLKIATAESCTGGLLSKTLTDIGGVSSVFELGLVTYSNRIKNEILNIPEEILNTFGAVSNITAENMAKNVAILAKSDIGVGITGIAGPTGATQTKPVGLVFFSIYLVSKDIAYTVKLNLDGDRNQVRNKTVTEVIDDLIKIIEQKM